MTAGIEENYIQNEILLHNFTLHFITTLDQIQNKPLSGKAGHTATLSGLAPKQKKIYPFINHCPAQQYFLPVCLKETSQDLQMLSSVTLHCQVTMIVMNPGS